jgi:hypothetical protein
MHLVIDAETDDPTLDLTPKEVRSQKQVENDTPAGDLRMMVAPRVVLPKVPKSILAADLA